MARSVTGFAAKGIGESVKAVITIEKANVLLGRLSHVNWPRNDLFKSTTAARLCLLILTNLPLCLAISGRHQDKS